MRIADHTPALWAAVFVLFACSESQRGSETPQRLSGPAVVQRPVAAEEPPPETFEIRSARIGDGRTLATSLSSMGLSGGEVSELIAALRKEGFDFRKSRAGDQVRLSLKGTLVTAMEYRSSPANEWLVSRRDGALAAAKRSFTIDKRLATVDISVESSLYEAMLHAGEDPSLAVEAADVFAWDIDFYRDVRRGDRLRVVVEKEFAQGRLLRYGQILGARYDGSSVGSKRYLRYVAVSGEASYFDEHGNSAKKAFLKSPLKYVHITSRFGGRKHPVLGFQHQHQGVDFSAAIGTPVWSVADGVVTRLVRGDPGGGNFLFVRHANGLETGYLHLSRFAEGVRTGARVRQKQVIAYSGNTGRSTGPHLHYAMKRGAHYLNPLVQKFPRTAPLSASERERFDEQTSHIAQLLAGERFAEVTAASLETAAP